MNDYIPLIKKLLLPDRFEHSLAVANAAKKLAQQYGADEEKAYICGILHDIMKNAGHDAQLEILEKGGIKLRDYELMNPKVWHAMAGCEYLRLEMGITDEDMLNAVRYHTTGRAGMSLLEKVLYIADFISADRTYDGVKQMRRLASVSLEDAMLFALRYTISDLIKRKKLVHPDSVLCYNELILNMEETK
ncbi:MAG: bis(5'-nucleosyl)-tetraphosphatase (symmetrical) YqeK [Clostridiales bacterium]|nr:bis(5'-nucleosyl)-tetraphosphatase (symmetrical) YqeK [Clostridiales bacterium]